VVAGAEAVDHASRRAFRFTRWITRLHETGETSIISRHFVRADRRGAD
jgi:hypothetical protein